jgi:DNA-binding XRE family transcriptional regulator
MNSFMDRTIRIETEMPVCIPTPDGKKIAETIMVKVPALQDPETKEIFLTGEALHMLDKAKARHMGVLLPDEIKDLRQRIGVTQKEMSNLLGIGEKTYTRWEAGRGRPTQSSNKILVALWEGHITVESLRSMRQPAFPWFDLVRGECPCGSEHRSTSIAANAEMEVETSHENVAVAA